MTLHSIIAAVETTGFWTLAVVFVLFDAVVVLLSAAKVGFLFWILATCWKKISRENARALATFLFYLLMVMPAYYAALLWMIGPYVNKMSDFGSSVLIMAPVAVIIWMIIATVLLTEPPEPDDGLGVPPIDDRARRAAHWALWAGLYAAALWFAIRTFPQWIGNWSYFFLIFEVPSALLPAMALSLKWAATAPARTPAVGVLR